MKAVIYARVSTKEQEREGYSIPAQLKLLREYAEKKGYEVVKEFVEAETAKATGRKQFKEMRQFLRRNKNIKNIIVEKTDRLYRNFTDYVQLDYENLNLSIHLVKEGDVLSKDSKSSKKFIHNIRLVMAKNYIDNLSEEVKKGMEEKLSRGGLPGVAPLGYFNKLDDHTIAIDPITAPLIKKAFEMASTGNYSLRLLSQTLYEKGLVSRRAKKKLGKQAMANILSNTFYYGVITRKGKKY